MIYLIICLIIAVVTTARYYVLKDNVRQDEALWISLLLIIGAAAILVSVVYGTLSGAIK